jgi:hypothetical protein
MENSIEMDEYIGTLQTELRKALNVAGGPFGRIDPRTSVGSGCQYCRRVEALLGIAGIAGRIGAEADEQESLAPDW